MGTIIAQGDRVSIAHAEKRVSARTLSSIVFSCLSTAYWFHGLTCHSKRGGYNGCAPRHERRRGYLATWGVRLRASSVIAFVISLLVQVGYPLAVTLYYRRRTRAPWAVFAYGALIFAAFQLLTWLPLSVYLDAVIGSHLNTEIRAFIWMWALALMTSLVEESGRWWGYKFLFPRGAHKFTWRNGVMYGLGHGSLETMLLLAGLTFIYFAAYLVLSRLDLNLLTQSLGAEASPAMRETLRSIVNTSWEQPILVALERVLALPHQVAWSLLVMESMVYRQKRWFGFAVLYHSSVAVIVPGLARLLGLAAAEGVNAALALFSLWIIFRLRAVSHEGES